LIVAAGYLLDTNVISETRNTRDVESIGVPLVDPWQARPATPG